MGVGRRGSSRSAPCAHALRPRHGDQECRKHCTCGAQGQSRSKTRPDSSIYISTRPYPARGLPAAPVLSYGTRSWALLNLHVPYTRATSRCGYRGALTRSSARKPRARRRHAGCCHHDHLRPPAPPGATEPRSGMYGLSSRPAAASIPPDSSSLTACKWPFSTSVIARRLSVR